MLTVLAVQGSSSLTGMATDYNASRFLGEAGSGSALTRPTACAIFHAPRVLDARSAAMVAEQPDILPTRWHWPILLSVALLLFGTRLSCPLLEPEETRYAEIPRQMLAQGRFVEPVWHGEPYYHKPPLLYWLVMVSYRLFGVADATARLVPALAAVLLVLLTYAWARSVTDAWTALLAALVLCLSARFVYLGRMSVIDGVLAVWVVAALAASRTKP